MRLLKITSIFVILTFLFMMGLVPNRDVTPGKGLTPINPDTTGDGSVPSVKGRIFERAVNLKERANEKSRNLKAGLTVAKGKLSTDLLQLIDDRFLFSSMSRDKLKEIMIRKQQIARNDSKVRGVKTMASEGVYVYIQLVPGQDPTILNSYVMNIENADRNRGLVAAWVEPGKLESLASLSAVKHIKTVEPPRHKVGSKNSAGDEQLHAIEIRNRLGYFGVGIKIGVISDGVDNWTAARDSGDLPATLHVLSNSVGGDEGTAMLEIIADLAPGAQLYFHDCGDNKLAFNTAIDNLVAAGCNVIVDDIGWITEPFFTDGVVAQHVSDVISGNQVVYVSAAGNEARTHYQGDFYQNSTYPGYHDFSHGQSGIQDLYALVPNGGTIKGVLQWNDPLLGSGNDYCVRLFDVTHNSYLGETLTVQDGDDDPIDSFLWTNETGEEIEVAVTAYKNTGVDKTLEIYLYPEDGASVYSINTSEADSIFGHPAVEGVIAVGAINSSDIGHDEIAPYSSRGPVTLLSGQRAKPDICGIDGVQITGSGGLPNPFYGTSAAAPHIAAIAGLLKGLYPAKSASDIKSMLTDSAVDLGNAGFDYVYGYGRAHALNAFNGNDITPPTVSVDAVTVTNGFTDNVAVTSSEWGRVYIVEQNQPQATVADLENARLTHIYGYYDYMNYPGMSVNVLTNGLIPGIYKAYAVDGANNISAASANSITITHFANRFTSIVGVDKTSARINDDSITVTVDLNDIANNAASYNWLYVASEGDCDFIVEGPYTWLVNADQMFIRTDINGYATFRVSSSIVGAFKIAFGLTDKIDDYLNVTATADEAGLITYKDITFTAPPSNNAYLSSISLSEGSLFPNFAQDTYNYVAYLNNNISSIDITAATSHAGATLTIDAIPVASGDPETVNLAVGENTIDIMVTAEDGVTTKIYQVVIYRSGGEVSAANSSVEIDAPLTKGAARNFTVTLKDVGNNLIFLTQKTLNIVVNVINNILDTTEVYTVHDDAAVNSDRTVLKTAITDVYGKMTFPVTIPAQVDLNDGINIAVKTQANELIEEFSYINTPSSNAELSGLTLNSGSLTPVFQSGTLAYSVSVANSVSSITFTPTKAEANSSYVIKKNGASEGVTGNTVSLDVGDNAISIIVTAQDGIATKEYTITVTRTQADTGGGSGGGGGGGGSSGGGAPPAQPPVQTQPSKLEKVYPGIGNPVTADDKKINESLQTTGSAKVDVTGSSENSANISGSVVSQLMSLNKPIIVANEGVQVNIATSNLSVSGENSTVRIGVNPLTEEGRDRILESSEWGQSTGIFVIGGQIFDLSAQIDTTENGTIDTQKIENFTEPVGVTLDLSGLNLTEGMINELCGVRLEKDAQGNTVFVRLGGFYNPANKTFTFYTDRFSLYSIMWTPKIKTMSFFVGADVVRINQNYKKIDVPPRIIGNRTMVPLRFIGEALGAQLDWDEKTRTVAYTLGNRGLKMTVDVKLPGQDMPPIIINGRTMVPLRYVSEYLGAKVTWFPSNKMVTVVK